MISTKLRSALSAAAILLVFGGPIVAVLGFLVFAFDSDAPTALALGAALRLFFGSLVAGGCLRLLASIDARLEVRG